MAELWLQPVTLRQNYHVLLTRLVQTPLDICEACVLTVLIWSW